MRTIDESDLNHSVHREKKGDRATLGNSAASAEILKVDFRARLRIGRRGPELPFDPDDGPGPSAA
jgi:hypothetical protein